MKKGTLLIIVLSAVTLTPLFGEKSEERGLMLQLGLGVAAVDYAEEFDYALDQAESIQGVERFTIFIDLGLGFAVTDKIVFLLSLSGVGDRVYNSSRYLQLNTYLYGAGIRYYPFRTGLILGLDAGPAKSLLRSNIGLGGSSAWGPGTRVYCGYDFAKKPRGFSVILGLSATSIWIRSERNTSKQVSLLLAWK